MPGHGGSRRDRIVTRAGRRPLADARACPLMWSATGAPPPGSGRARLLLRQLDARAAGPGESCVNATACATGTCTGGVCCDRECVGSCQVCSAAGVCTNQAERQACGDGSGVCFGVDQSLLPQLPACSGDAQCGRGAGPAGHRSPRLITALFVGVEHLAGFSCALVAQSATAAALDRSNRPARPRRLAWSTRWHGAPVPAGRFAFHGRPRLTEFGVLRRFESLLSPGWHRATRERSRDGSTAFATASLSIVAEWKAPGAHPRASSSSW